MQDSDPQLSSQPDLPLTENTEIVEQEGAYQNPATLPPGRTPKAVLYGVVAAVITAGIGLLVTFLNAPLYSHAPATSASSSVQQTYAFTVLGLGCLTFFLSQLIFFLAGFLCGKTLIERKQGFLAGFIGGALSYALSFLAVYIPGFPGKISATGATSGQMVAGGLIISLIFLLVNGGIGGIFGVFGARMATRRHPYYIPKDEYDDEVAPVK